MRSRVGLVLLGSAVLPGWISACSTTPSKLCAADTSAEQAGQVRQGIETDPIRGTGLTPKHLSLTFDEGPGPDTPEISEYLADLGIVATFFVVGSAASGQQAVLQKVYDDGHLLANHTQTNQDLTGLAPLEVQSEVLLVDAVIAPYVERRALATAPPESEHFLFRAPGTAWDPATYAALAASPATNKYVGPISWDIGSGLVRGPGGVLVAAVDKDCWLAGETPRSCSDGYFAEATARTRGIVRLHDGAVPGGGVNKTLAMLRILVPRWIGAGYTFLPLDELPSVSRRLPPPPPVPTGDGSTASPEASIPSPEASTPSPEASTPSPEASTPSPADAAAPGPGAEPDPCEPKK